LTKKPKKARIQPMNPAQSVKNNPFPTLYLARHGQTNFNRDRIFQGRTNNPLNVTGAQQAFAIAELLQTVNFTRAYVSPLIRAATTADAIMVGRQIPLKVENRLTEIDFGDWEGTPEVEVKERWMEDYMDYRNDMGSFHPSNGESAVDAQKRAGEWWDEVSSEFPNEGENILVVAHQSINAVLACYVCGIPLKDAWTNFKSKTGEVIKIIPGAIAQVSKIVPEVE